MAHAGHPGAETGPYTWDDFVALEEDDPRELFEGWLEEVDVPTEQHEFVVALLVHFLVAWARPRRAGRVHASGYKVRVSERRGVMPDVQFYRKDNPARLGAQGLEQGRPDLAVEVISPTSRQRDRVEKLRYYASIGVPEYWIVDPEGHTLQRLVLEGERYTIADALGGDDTFRPDSFEGLEIPLSELWEQPGADG
ncbi:MAG: Uma2 family endonuclease [Myxococcota bacterium]